MLSCGHDALSRLPTPADTMTVYWDAEPGYRTRDLTNDEAWDAMQDAASRMVREALAARKALLDLGFADDHSLCKQLDQVAAWFAAAHTAVRYQRGATDPTPGDTP
jgi:hypothetical protein